MCIFCKKATETLKTSTSVNIDNRLASTIAQLFGYRYIVVPSSANIKFSLYSGRCDYVSIENLTIVICPAPYSYDRYHPEGFAVRIDGKEVNLDHIAIENKEKLNSTLQRAIAVLKAELELQIFNSNKALKSTLDNIIM